MPLDREGNFHHTAIVSSPPEFEFVSPGQVIFGPGTIRRIGDECQRFGLRALLVTGKSPHRARPVTVSLGEVDIGVVTFAVANEPTIACVERGIAVARQAGCDFVVACGGGAAIDCGKAIAALLPNSGQVLDYLEVIGKGRRLVKDPLPFVAVPTTAGTGSEATRNAVPRSPEHGVKVSLRDARMLPNLAIIDPELAISLPPAATAATGIDALTQLLEAYVCNRSNPFSDALCAAAIPRVARSLRRAVANGADVAARSDLAFGAMLSGMALANAGLGAVHGWAAPLGGRFNIPHGLACAALLPGVWEVNLAAVTERGTDEQRARFHQAAIWLTGKSKPQSQGGVRWLRRLKNELRIPTLISLGVTTAHWDLLLPAARRSSSMSCNPIELTEIELKRCLEIASGSKLTAKERKASADIPQSITELEVAPNGWDNAERLPPP